MAISLLGGKCIKCNSPDNLQFDHIDPATKAFNITAWTRPLEEWMAELQKCQLLCYSCHKAKSAEEAANRKIVLKEDNSLIGYIEGCRCGMYKIALTEQKLKSDCPKGTKIPSRAIKYPNRHKSKQYIFQRWYFWSKLYYNNHPIKPLDTPGI